MTGGLQGVPQGRRPWVEGAQPVGVRGEEGPPPRGSPGGSPASGGEAGAPDTGASQIRRGGIPWDPGPPDGILDGVPAAAGAGRL